MRLGANGYLIEPLFANLGKCHLGAGLNLDFSTSIPAPLPMFSMYQFLWKYRVLRVIYHDHNQFIRNIHPRASPSSQNEGKIPDGHTVERTEAWGMCTHTYKKFPETKHHMIKDGNRWRWETKGNEPSNGHSSLPLPRECFPWKEHPNQA